ncbi:hypothetical protein Cni_G14700 [Canna indica]|uniref:Uncharacterized protein n=1 Tax=Canna indica TaxID=4628 RepID=A0AAQ3QCL7_9LILI|nr:hypothetical protein Cni_G14700 [Canna indica]
MASSAAAPDQPFHVRSISLPSRPHPVAVKIKEELQNLKAAATSSLSTTDICNGLRDVGNLYDSVEELLHLPSLQQTVFGSAQKRRLEDELEVSVMLLDLVDNMKDSLVAMNEHVRDLRLALRRRGNKNLQEKEHQHFRARKGIQRNVNKCCKALKQMDERCGVLVPLEKDTDLSLVVRALVESGDVTLSVLDSVLQLLSLQWKKPKVGRWSFLLKGIRRSKVACEDAQQKKAKDLSLCFSYRCIVNKDVDGERILQAQGELNAAEATIVALKHELGSLMRRLIQCRVSFLNLLSLS